MASAVVEYAAAERPIKSVALTLTPYEAVVLRNVTGSIAGCGPGREAAGAIFHALFHALDKAGIIGTEVPSSGDTALAFLGESEPHVNDQ